jgi:hypothetical protein
VGLREDAGAFFICLGVILLVSNIAQSLGLLVSVGTELPYALSPQHHPKTSTACAYQGVVCVSFVCVSCVSFVCVVCVCVCVA